MTVDRKGAARLTERPPRLVLRFAILSALCLGVGGAAILGVTRHLITVQAQRGAAEQAKFAAETTLADELRSNDFRGPVSARRRGELDSLMQRGLLRHGALLVTLSRADRVVTYATDHSLIGRKLASAERTSEALAGTLTSDVSAITDGGSQMRLKVLRSYVPLSPRDGGRGIAGIHQDYEGVAAAARRAFLPVAGILELVLVLLYLLLVPLLARVSRRIRSQIQRIEHQALHDDLTDLPNRLQFRRRIDQALVAAEVEGAEVAVLFLDLDRFKEINETLGHRSGDDLLEEVGSRLGGLLPEDALLARLGGDEFGIVVTGASTAAAAELAARIRGALESPFVLSSIPVVVEASVGLAMFPRDGADAETLIQRADVAMYAAKDRRLGVVWYEPELETSTAEQLSLLSEFRRAVDEHELVLYFQPKASLGSGEIYGVEALIRWDHPGRGLLQPAAFVPLVERTGLSRSLSRYVLGGAVEQLREWRDEGLDLAVGVNLTAFDLLDDSLPDEVAGLLEIEGVEPSLLELEITESVIMGDPVRVREVLNRLKAIGVQLAIDDFGTGFTSLSYVKSLPIDVLKIDRSFVMNMQENASDRAIVRSTTELAHNLGLTVVAEGVESDEIWRQLREFGCDAAQGFHISRPCPVDGIGAALSAWQKVSALGRRPYAAA